MRKHSLVLILAALMVCSLVPALGEHIQVPYSYSGVVWQDDNGNGIQDGSEVGIAGVRVVLHNAFGPWPSVVAMVTTNADGVYQLSGDLPIPDWGYTFSQVIVAPDSGGLDFWYLDWSDLGDIPPGWIPTTISPAGEYQCDFIFCDQSGNPPCEQTNLNFGFQPAARVAV